MACTAVGTPQVIDAEFKDAQGMMKTFLPIIRMKAQEVIDKYGLPKHALSLLLCSQRTLLVIAWPQ